MLFLVWRLQIVDYDTGQDNTNNRYIISSG